MTAALSALGGSVSQKLYVGNLSYSTTDGDLTSLFSQFGSVQSAQVITDRDSGRSKGFAFVEMDSSESCSKAVDELDGQDFDGRTIRVNIARPREDRGNQRGGFSRNRY